MCLIDTRVSATATKLTPQIVGESEVLTETDRVRVRVRYQSPGTVASHPAPTLTASIKIHPSQVMYWDCTCRRLWRWELNS